LIDDIDTDAECLNPELIEKKIKWINEALIPTRSISRGLLLIACGNIIADFCCVSEMGAKARSIKGGSWEIINIRDENGVSSWPQKNTEEAIDRVKDTISYEAWEKEYNNNPMDGGKTFTNLVDTEAFRLKYCNHVIIYADPAPSDSESKQSSSKAIGIIANNGLDFQVYKAWVDRMTNAKFVDYLFEAYRICKQAGVDPIVIFVENNTLQNSHYEQVLLPAIFNKQEGENINLPITPDERKKPHKWTRIEGTLEVLIRLARLTFNMREKENPHMIRLKKQFTNANPKSKALDGPDMVEGGVKIIQNKIAAETVGGVDIYERKPSRHRL